MTEKSDGEKPVAAAQVWKVAAKVLPRLAGDTAERAATARVSAAWLAAVDASTAGGRTVTCQATFTLASARAASARRAAWPTAAVIHDAGTPKAAARFATSAVMIVEVPAMAAAVAGTDTVSVSVTVVTSVGDGESDGGGETTSNVDGDGFDTDVRLTDMEPLAKADASAEPIVAVGDIMPFAVWLGNTEPLTDAGAGMMPGAVDDTLALAVRLGDNEPLNDAEAAALPVAVRVKLPLAVRLGDNEPLFEADN